MTWMGTGTLIIAIALGVAVGRLAVAIIHGLPLDLSWRDIARVACRLECVVCGVSLLRTGHAVAAGTSQGVMSSDETCPGCRVGGRHVADGMRDDQSADPLAARVRANRRVLGVLLLAGVVIWAMLGPVSFVGVLGTQADGIRASLVALLLLILAGSVTVIAVIDLRWWVIPDEMVIATAVAGVGYTLLGEPPGLGIGRSAILVVIEELVWAPATTTMPTWLGDQLAGLARALLLGGGALGLRAVFSWWRRAEALGLGDVKLLGVAGLWLPVAVWPVYIGVAAGLGLLTAIGTGVAIRGRTAPGAMETVDLPNPAAGDVPFGPGLAGALLAMVLIVEAGLSGLM